MPAIVGRDGVEEVLEIPLSDSEKRALRGSAEQMKRAIRTLGL